MVSMLQQDYGYEYVPGSLGFRLSHIKSVSTSSLWHTDLEKSATSYLDAEMNRIDRRYID